MKETILDNLLANKTPASMKVLKATNYFRERTPSQQQQLKAHYERIIGLAKGDIPGPESGRLKYMIPHWEKGLEILNEVIHEREMQNK